jgi:hypothetical protein
VAVREAERVDLRVRVEWSGAGDLDLDVTEPQGTVCSRENPYSTGGGILLHDGAGPNPKNCYDEYASPIAWSGEYRIRVLHSWGNIVGKRATVTITRAIGNQMLDKEVIPVAITPEGTTLRVTLKNGRRRAPAAPMPVSRKAERGKQGPSILAQLQPGVPSVGPAVGAGGVGYQPVVQSFSEGISMAAMATVSGDRRYVRLDLTPVFSNITDVFTFSFQR